MMAVVREVRDNCRFEATEGGAALNAFRHPQMHDGSSCFAGRMYVVGGSDGQSSLTSVEIYDFESRTWTHGPNMNIARANVALAVVGQRLYAVGGFSGKHFLNSSEFLAKDLKEWSTFAPRLASSLSGSESSTESDAPVSDVESYSNDALVTSARNAPVINKGFVACTRAQ